MNSISNKVVNNRVIQELIKRGITTETEVHRFVEDETAKATKSPAKSSDKEKETTEPDEKALGSTGKEVLKILRALKGQNLDNDATFRNYADGQNDKEAIVRFAARVDRLVKDKAKGKIYKQILKNDDLEKIASKFLKFLQLNRLYWNPDADDVKALKSHHKAFFQQFYERGQSLKNQTELVKNLRNALKAIATKEKAEQAKGFVRSLQEDETSPEDAVIDISSTKASFRSLQTVVGKVKFQLSRWQKSAKAGNKAQFEYKAMLVKVLESFQDLIKRVYNSTSKMVGREVMAEAINPANVIDISQKVETAFNTVNDNLGTLFPSRGSSQSKYPPIDDAMRTVKETLAALNAIIKYFPSLGKFGETSVDKVEFDQIEREFDKSLEKINSQIANVNTLPVKIKRSQATPIEVALDNLIDFSIRVAEIFGVPGLKKGTKTPDVDGSGNLPGDDQAPQTPQSQEISSPNALKNYFNMGMFVKDSDVKKLFAQVVGDEDQPWAKDDDLPNIMKLIGYLFLWRDKLSNEEGVVQESDQAPITAAVTMFKAMGLDPAKVNTFRSRIKSIEGDDNAFLAWYDKWMNFEFSQEGRPKFQEFFETIAAYEKQNPINVKQMSPTAIRGLNDKEQGEPEQTSDQEPEDSKESELEQELETHKSVLLQVIKILKEEGHQRNSIDWDMVKTALNDTDTNNEPFISGGPAAAQSINNILEPDEEADSGMFAQLNRYLDDDENPLLDIVNEFIDELVIEVYPLVIQNYEQLEKLIIDRDERATERSRDAIVSFLDGKKERLRWTKKLHSISDIEQHSISDSIIINWIERRPGQLTGQGKTITIDLSNKESIKQLIKDLWFYDKGQNIKQHALFHSDLPFGNWWQRRKITEALETIVKAQLRKMNG